jgi:hypothetical protein
MGIPVGEFTPGKGQDKISRVNAVSDLFRSGIVWAPDRRWAKEVIEECNDFPSGANDDLVDSTTLALMRFRQGGFITQIKKILKKVPWVGAALTAATSANAGDLVEGFSPIPFGELGNSDIDIPASEFLRRLESGEKIPQKTIDRLMAKKIQGGQKIID